MLPTHCKDKPPWSGKALRRLGERVRDGADVSDHVPNYDEVLLWYDDLSASVQGAIREVDWTSILGDEVIEVTSRAKTIDTLREKLQRDHGTPLPSIQDVAGVRFEANMVLRQQDAVAQRIAEVFEHDATVIRDIRKDPHSGYRAVHIWLRLPAGRVEVQVRTHLQGKWANMYEALADTHGRQVRYGELPADPDAAILVRSVQELSLDKVASLEETMDLIYELEQELVQFDLEVADLQQREVPGAETVAESHQKTRQRVTSLRERCRSEIRDYTEMFETLERSLRDAG
jgi:ppGpp synthetase/RelA/SpoT-type nucleotidyltranferase